MTTFFLLIALTFQLSTFDGSSAIKTDPSQDNWIWLFNGSNTDHWRMAHKDEFPKRGWSIEGNMLVVNKGGDKKNRGGSIITREKYGSFDLRFEFKLTEGANSGLKYFVKVYPDGAVLGCEYQIIDDFKNKDIANDVDGTRLTAGLYELYEAKGKKLKPAGKWNTAGIVVKGKHVEHWLNGIKVLEYERGSKEFLDARAKSKFKDVSDFGLIEEGHILLQDHGDETTFRNIKIKKL